MDEKKRIDLDTWPRAAYYRRFTEDIPCSATLADDIDVTELRNACRSSGRSFHLSVLWLVSAAVNAHEEFRLTETDSPEDPFPVPAVWNVVHPVHNVFHPETETFTSTFTLFSPDPYEFEKRAKEDTERAERLDIPAIPAPPNVFETSAVPWRHFTPLPCRRSSCGEDSAKTGDGPICPSLSRSHTPRRTVITSPVS